MCVFYPQVIAAEQEGAYNKGWCENNEYVEKGESVPCEKLLPG